MSKAVTPPVVDLSTTSAVDITAMTLTYDEEPNIARALDAVAWLKDIRIIDSGTTNATLDIVARCPSARVVTRKFVQTWARTTRCAVFFLTGTMLRPSTRAASCFSNCNHGRSTNPVQVYCGDRGKQKRHADHAGLGRLPARRCVGGRAEAMMRASTTRASVAGAPPS
jgi:hypothetical protein